MAMTNTPNRDQDEYADKFTEAANDWDLARLYGDLETVKQQQPGIKNRIKLTPLEQTYLRGLLCGNSPDNIARTLERVCKGRAGASVNVDLTRGLYRYVEALTGRELNTLNNWRDISKWLEEAGYKKNSTPPPPPPPPPSDFYVDRPPIEEQCYQEMGQPGSLLRIKAPQGMGKTWLINKILKNAESQGYHKVYISLMAANEADLNDLDSFLRWFCEGVRQGLKLSTQLPETWEDSRVNNKKCKNYFEDYVLNKIDSRLVLGLDVVDRIFQYPFAVEFLSMLRSWHEEAKSYDIWKKLCLVMAYSTEAYIPIDAHCSPFNVGVSVNLPEFSQEQVQQLIDRYRLDWDSTQVEILMDLVGGHPKLLDIALSKSRIQGVRLEEVLRLATIPSGIYYDHLQQLLQHLGKHSQLATAMKKVVYATEAVKIESDEIAFQLYSLGLVKLNENGAEPRCKLYQHYFRNRLGGT